MFKLDMQEEVLWSWFLFCLIVDNDCSFIRICIIVDKFVIL